MEKKITAIRTRLKDGTYINFYEEGGINLQPAGKFLRVNKGGETLAAFATSEISFIEYFYSEAENKQ